MEFTNYKKLGIVLNKVRGDIKHITNRLEELNLPLLAKIPEDPNILEFDMKGTPIIDIPQNSPSLLSINKLVETIINKR